MTATIDVDALRERFVEYGLQYYAAGRYAVTANSNPVAADILHHAVQMFLQAGLCPHTTENQRKYELVHKLPKIWQLFKSHYDPEEELARFDNCVRGCTRLKRSGIRKG